MDGWGELYTVLFRIFEFFKLCKAPKRMVFYFQLNANLLYACRLEFGGASGVDHYEQKHRFDVNCIV